MTVKSLVRQVQKQWSKRRKASNNLVSPLQAGDEKSPHSLEFLEWLWDLFHQVIISLLAYEVREPVATAWAGLSSSPAFAAPLLLHNAIAAGVSQAYLHSLEFPEGEVPLCYISTRLLRNQ